MIQCFAATDYDSSFTGERLPRLLSTSKIDSSYTVHPRILHKHDDFLEVLLVLSGTGVYIVDEQRYSIKAGDLILCNAGVLHDEDPSVSSNLNMMCIAITDMQVAGLPRNHLIKNSTAPVFSAGEYAEMFGTMITTIHSLLATEEESSTETCHYLTLAFLSKLLQFLRKHSDSSGGIVHSRADIIVAQVKNYINTHFDEPFTLKDISNAIHVSPYHLSHVFKAQTGYSPMQYTLRRRLGEAQTLLISTKMSITDISSTVGFVNLCHFNAMFSKYIGMPPSKYRTSYVNEENIPLSERRGLL